MDIAQLDAPLEEPEPAAGPSRRRRVVAAFRTHWLLVVLLTVGAGLRFASLLVYRPAFLFWRDSYEYLEASRDMTPPVTRTLGYPLLLRILGVTSPESSTMVLVPIVQHLLGLGLGLGVYAILRRRTLPPTWSALAAAPVLLDGYQLDIEQFVLSETLFSALLLLTLGLVLTAPTVSIRRALVLGLVASAVTLTRSVALPLVVLLGAYLLLRRVGWRPVVVFATAAMLPVLAYATWFDAVHQSFGLQLMSGRLLYGKTAQFADCARLPEAQQPLCPRTRPEHRLGQNFWSFTPLSPQKYYPYTRNGDAVLGRFARTVIARQPGKYARIVAGDLLHYAGPTRVPRPRDQRLVTWQFPNGRTPDFTVAIAERAGWRGGGIRAPVTGGAADFLHGYQRVSLPGLGLVLCGVVTLVGAVRRPRPKREPVGETSAVSRVAPARRGRGVRLDCLLLASVGLMLVVVPAFTVALDYRFLLPELVVLPVGAALALSARPLGHSLRLSRSVRWRPRRSRGARSAPAAAGAATGG